MKIKQKANNKSDRIRIILLTIFLISLLFILIVMTQKLTKTSKKQYVDTDMKKYQYHYVFISDNMDDGFFQELYDNLYREGKEKGVYVENQEKTLATDYTKEEYLSMAINMNVDGIIMEGDSSSSITKLVDKAFEKNIPVMTVMNDCPRSKRQCYVSPGSYNLGKEYGNLLMDMGTDNEQKILIITQNLGNKTLQTLVYTGISESLIRSTNNHFTLNNLNITDNSPFTTTKLLRDLFIDKTNTPNVIICLNEKDTVSACQAVIDYNLVGKVKIIGFYTSDTVMDALQKDIISATFYVDVSQIASSCIDAMNGYKRTSHINEFIAFDTTVITASNLESFPKSE